MAVKLLSSSSGSVTLDVPVTASNFALTLPAANGTVITTGSTGQIIPKAALPTGSVLQVVQGTYQNQGSTSSTSLVDTGLSVSITPTNSSSKVLVLVNLNGCLTLNGSTAMLVELIRGSSSICKFGEAGLNGGTNRNDFGDFAVSYLDSPATTSSTTYKVQAKSSAGGTVYWCNQTNNSVSTITAMEISA